MWWVLAVVTLLTLPASAPALTGVIVPPSKFKGVSGDVDEGQVAVKFYRLADHTHPTRWRLVTAEGVGPWNNVLPCNANVTKGVSKLAQVYGIEFERKTTNPRDKVPQPRTLTVVGGQLTILVLRYK
jgi:hypothetical protein